MYRKGLKFCIVFLGLIVFSSITGVTAFTYKEYSQNPDSFALIVEDAHYADLDGDYTEDDVWMKMCFIFPSTRKSVNIELHVALELPSGLIHYAYFKILIKNYNEVHFMLEALNTATEPGWYNIYASANCVGSGEPTTSQSVLTFDPPFAGKGGDPISWKFGLC